MYGGQPRSFAARAGEQLLPRGTYSIETLTDRRQGIGDRCITGDVRYGRIEIFERCIEIPDPRLAHRLRRFDHSLLGISDGLIRLPQLVNRAICSDPLEVLDRRVKRRQVCAELSLGLFGRRFVVLPSDFGVTMGRRAALSGDVREESARS
jgi:hypothetical protein